MMPVYTVYADDSDETIVLTFGDLHIPPKITHEPEAVEPIAREAIARRFDIPAHSFALRIEWSSLNDETPDP